MIYAPRKHQPEIELWNVSLLPTVLVTPSPTPPPEPGGAARPAPGCLAPGELTEPAALVRAA